MNNFNNYNPHNTSIVSKTFVDYGCAFNDQERPSPEEIFEGLHQKAEEWLRKNNAEFVSLQTHANSLNEEDQTTYVQCNLTIVGRINEKEEK